MRAFLLTFTLGILSLPLLPAADDYPPGPDSKVQEGVPKGQLIKVVFKAGAKSVFPGTEREVTLYLPQQLDRKTSAPFMVFQDGVIYQAPTVFDNLIARKEIPPLIGIFIKPGVVPAANENALPRFNRSFEYDSATGTYARFLIDELLPWLKETQQLNLSENPDDRAIAGSSSGGIAAFMVAWEKPDTFHRVFTNVGTYVGIHGADQLPVLIRKTEPKPIRIFLQSGINDNNIYCGDWWMANQMMERSFAWAGYEVNHVWGEGGHNQKHATQIFPDVLRWLWKGWPEEKITANPRKESKWLGYDVLESESQWELTAEGPPSLQTSPTKLERTTLSPDQTLLYTTSPNSRYVNSSQVQPDKSLQYEQPFFYLDSPTDSGVEAGGLCVDKEGRVYVATKLGIQVCDQAGRVNFIIPTPQTSTDVCFGGAELNELYVVCGDKIYKRKAKVQGITAGSSSPIKPAAPRL